MINIYKVLDKNKYKIIQTESGFKVHYVKNNMLNQEIYLRIEKKLNKNILYSVSRDIHKEIGEFIQDPTAIATDFGIGAFFGIFDSIKYLDDLKHVDNIPKIEVSQSFDNWDDLKNAHKGTVTQYVADNKPLGSTHPRDWLKDPNNSLKIDTLDDGTQVWHYTSGNTTVSYVPKAMTDGTIQNVIKFPDELIFKESDFNGVFKLEEGFSGNRNVDKSNALKYLEDEFGITEIPDGYVLHHDIDNGVFQIVDKNAHELFSHYGGHYYNK
ncbi:MAG: hypothetical protein R3Y24_02685 [Eubacteriales bacterium]